MDGASPTATVKAWLSAGALPLSALIVNPYVPPLPAVGVPASVAVPFPLSVKLSQAGRVPLVGSAGVGAPLVVPENAPAAPTAKEALSALVMVGAPDTVSVAAVDVALPVELENTARYWLPLSPAAVVKV